MENQVKREALVSKEILADLEEMAGTEAEDQRVTQVLQGFRVPQGDQEGRA